MPALPTLLNDLSRASDKQLSKHLGIQPSTLATYRRQGSAPTPVMHALFWESRWGRSEADTEAANWGAMYYRQAKILEAELQRMAANILLLERELERASAAGGFMPANLPIFRVS